MGVIKRHEKQLEQTVEEDISAIQLVCDKLVAI